MSNEFHVRFGLLVGIAMSAYPRKRTFVLQPRDPAYRLRRQTAKLSAAAKVTHAK